MTLYLLKMFPRFSETFILSEILELERRGRSIEIVSLKKPNDGRFHEDLARVRASVTYLPEQVRSDPRAFVRAHRRLFRRNPGAWSRGAALAIRFGAAAWPAFVRAPLVAQVARARGCARIHAHFASLPAITAMFAAWFAEIPFSFTAHAKDIFIDGRPTRLLRELMRRADRVITVSEFNRRYLFELAQSEIPIERVALVYNGIDLEAFRPRATAPGGDAPLILAVGRLVEKKGFELLVEACESLRNSDIEFRCEIAGKGPLEGALAQSIARRGLESRVRLVGPLTRENVARRLADAAVLAAPCVIGADGNRDGLPTVILEAMAAGRAVVATRVTGIPEAVVDGATGRVVEPGDVPALACALAGVLVDPERTQAMGRAGRRLAEERFDLRRNVALLDAWLDDGSRVRGSVDSPASAPASGVGVHA